MKTRNVIAIAAVMGMGALGIAGSAKADVEPIQDTVNAELTVNSITELDVVKNFGVITPSFSQIRAGLTGSITEPGAFTVNIATNNANGCLITVKAETGDHETDKIAAGDIELKYSSNAESGDFSTFTALDTDGKDFWSTGDEVLNTKPIAVDMKISNLRTYVAKDAQTVYNNTITFEAVANSN